MILFIIYSLLFSINFINAYYWHTSINKTNTTIAVQYLSSSYSLGCPLEEIKQWSCDWCIQHQNQYLEPYEFIYSDITNTFSSILLDNIEKNIIIVFNYTDFNNLIGDLFYTKCIPDNSTVFKKYYRVPGQDYEGQDPSIYKEIPLKEDPSLRSDNRRLSGSSLNIKNVCIGDYYEQLYLSVHYQLYNNVLNAIIQYPDYSFVFTGYSVGGALTTIAAIDLKLKFNIKVKNVYTFGSPRVGNLEFTKLFYKYIGNSFRMTNNNDIVPHLPLQKQGFNHVSTEVWRISNDKDIINEKYINCINTNGFNEYKKCIGSLDETELNLEDHFNYMNLNYKCKN